jgi:hypothetical protein
MPRQIVTNEEADEKKRKRAKEVRRLLEAPPGGDNGVLSWLPLSPTRTAATVDGVRYSVYLEAEKGWVAVELREGRPQFIAKGLATLEEAKGAAEAQHRKAHGAHRVREAGHWWDADATITALRPMLGFANYDIYETSFDDVLVLRSISKIDAGLAKAVIQQMNPQALAEIEFDDWFGGSGKWETRIKISSAEHLMALRHARRAREVLPMEFETWMFRVDQECWKLAGVGAEDLADMPFKDWYDEDYSPREAAEEALRREGLRAARRSRETVDASGVALGMNVEYLKDMEIRWGRVSQKDQAGNGVYISPAAEFGSLQMDFVLYEDILRVFGVRPIRMAESDYGEEKKYEVERWMQRELQARAHLYQDAAGEINLTMLAEEAAHVHEIYDPALPDFANIPEWVFGIAFEVADQMGFIESRRTREMVLPGWTGGAGTLPYARYDEGVGVWLIVESEADGTWTASIQSQDKSIVHWHDEGYWSAEEAMEVAERECQQIHFARSSRRRTREATRQGIVKAGTKSWFVEGEPSVAEFAQDTPVTVEGPDTSGWYTTVGDVPGFPSGKQIYLKAEHFSSLETRRAIRRRSREVMTGRQLWDHMIAPLGPQAIHIFAAYSVDDWTKFVRGFEDQAGFDKLPTEMRTMPAGDIAQALHEYAQSLVTRRRAVASRRGKRRLRTQAGGMNATEFMDEDAWAKVDRLFDVRPHNETLVLACSRAAQEMIDELGGPFILLAEGGSVQTTVQGRVSAPYALVQAQTGEVFRLSLEGDQLRVDDVREAQGYDVVLKDGTVLETVPAHSMTAARREASKIMQGGRRDRFHDWDADGSRIVPSGTPSLEEAFAWAGEDVALAISDEVRAPPEDTAVNALEALAASLEAEVPNPGRQVKEATLTADEWDEARRWMQAHWREHVNAEGLADTTRLSNAYINAHGSIWATRGKPDVYTHEDLEEEAFIIFAQNGIPKHMIRGALI